MFLKSLLDDDDDDDDDDRVTTHLENTEKSGNWIMVRENGKSQG